MDQSVIDYIYYNDDMRNKIETDAEFEKLELRSGRVIEKLKAMLTEEQKEIFERLEEVVMEEYNIACKLYFRQGMKVGIRVVAEGMFD